MEDCETHAALIPEGDRILDENDNEDVDLELELQDLDEKEDLGVKRKLIENKLKNISRKIWIIICYLSNCYPLARLKIYLRTSDYILFSALILFNIIFFLTSCKSCFSLSTIKRSEKTIKK